MSKKSYKKWLLVNSLSQYLYKKFSLIVSQDLTNGNRYKMLGGNNVMSGINLKNGITANHMNYKEEEEIIALTNKRPILLFASIHDKIEDQAAIASHIEAKKNNADLLTIIVPRHTKMIKNLISLVDIYKLKTKIRSKKQEPDCNTEIYIADTIGELGSFMKISDICFVGGSLSPKGGHNLIEPALEKCAIIYGPDVSNHANTSEILLKENAAIQINNINELKTEICKLMNDKKEIKKMVDKAYNVINNIPDPSYILLNQIKPYLKAHGE
jgi:3-deoxy-D-manno-octulosonic-acid transferase